MYNIILAGKLLFIHPWFSIVSRSVKNVEETPG